MKSKALVLVASLLIFVLVLGAVGTKLAIAEAIQATWGTPIDLPSETVDQQTVEKAGEKYGAIILFHASSASWSIQDLMNRAMADTVSEIQKQGRTPLYVKAEVESPSCAVGLWCSYDIKVTIQYQTPQNQQSIIAYIILAIIIAVIAYLSYLNLTKIVEALHYIAENPILQGFSYLIALVLLAAIIGTVILWRRRQS